MADDVREYLRAAQAAEVKGDKPEAVALLRKVATLYRAQGNSPRALQMLRHARRLDGSSAELDHEIKRLEWMPSSPRPQPVDEEEADRALASLDAFARPSAALVERGPTRADPALAAWCSFCCRPHTEVGNLVAGPAGAFICASCVPTCSGLLGGTIQRAATPTSVNAPLFVKLSGQVEPLKLLDAGLRRGSQVILLVGPAGCGKTTYLLGLESDGMGTRVTHPEAVSQVAPGQRLLVDCGDPALTQAVMDAAGGRPLLIVARGKLPAAGFSLVSEEGEVPVYPSEGLCEGTAGQIPLTAAERVQVAVEFRAASVADLTPVARALIERRASELDVSDALVSALASAAAASPRGGHELEALVRRLPPGSWGVRASPPPPKRRRGKTAK